jgi:hypothetical protein
LIEPGQDELVLDPVGQPFGGDHVGKVGQRYVDTSNSDDVRTWSKVVISPTGGLEGDVEFAEGTLEIPHLGPHQGSSVVRERQTFAHGIGADTGTQFDQRRREAVEVLSVGRRGEVDVVGDVSAMKPWAT